ncbi:MAG: peptidase T [Ignavibacteriaceae bacterium]|nr:peptidase T [Ignavibacteriaceae bacterium]
MLKKEFTCEERFIRYARIWTTSDPDSGSFPSTDRQKDLSQLLVNELHEMGISDAELDEYGYVYATVPSNTDKNVPVICLCAHVDTSPDAHGENVNPIKHENYNGGDIILSGDSSKVILFSEHPELANQIGNDIITTDGTTLLGADDKAGVAEIMEAVYYLLNHPELKHGKLRILFTPDEEIGRGVDKVDMNKLGADIGYTIDGETLGELQNETFSADSLVINIQGFNIHPGFAQGRLENAIKIAAEILDKLPKDSLSPETTHGKEGFVHPVSINGDVDKAIIKFIIRDFETDGLKLKEGLLENICNEVLSEYKKSSYKIEVTESYRNMKEIVDKDPRIIEYAMEAIRRAGVKPKLCSIRGGTDGSRLSFMGLPCPNIFAGGHAFHSVLEWISVQDMMKAVETIVNLVQVWEENS